ncbi:MAG: PEP-CTERM sorting domain-containing protein [Luteolibacter sp.]
MTQKHLFALVAVTTMAAASHCDAVTILNPGFELPAHTANDGTDPTNWTVVETITGTNPDRQVRTRNTGARSGAMSVQLGAGNSNHEGQLYQTVTTAIGQLYTFSIWGSVLNNSNTPELQNFRVDLVDGTGVAGTSLANVTSAGTLSTTYKEFTVNFTAISTETTIWIRDISTAGTADGNDIFLDDVSITAIPEPSAAALLGLGALSLVLRRRK